MNRRNFVGSILALGAGFSILPTASTYNRIWTPERALTLEVVGSIWQTHRVTYESVVKDIRGHRRTHGAVAKWKDKLWYGTPYAWVELVKMRNPLETCSPQVPLLDVSPITVTNLSEPPRTMKTLFQVLKTYAVDKAG